MAKKILNIVESAYRATLEEQDDTIVWLSHAMKRAGADLGVLLRGNAVACGVNGQDASGLSFGDKRQTQPPRLALDIAKLIESGVEVFFVKEDAGERGIQAGDLIDNLTAVSKADLPRLLGDYDQICHW